jgi:hypothetical protein
MRAALTMGNDGHVTDVLRLVHQLTDLPWLLAACLDSDSIRGRGCGVSEGFVRALRTSSTVKLADC